MKPVLRTMEYKPCGLWAEVSRLPCDSTDEALSLLDTSVETYRENGWAITYPGPSRDYAECIGPNGLHLCLAVVYPEER